MTYTATLTSKQQLTLPAAVLRQLNWRQGQKLLVQESAGQIILSPATDLVNRLSGSVSLPKRFKGKSLDQIISQALDQSHAV